MFVFLSKLLPLLIYPLSLACLLIVLALLLRRRRWAPALLAAAFFGFEVMPAPADYLISEDDWRSLTYPDLRNQLEQLLPDAHYLFWTTSALKEYIGIVVYSLRGWM